MIQLVLAAAAGLSFLFSQTSGADDGGQSPATTAVNFEELRENAVAGDADDQFELAFELFLQIMDAEPVREDLQAAATTDEARQWAQAAANQDHAEAVNLLGNIASLGFGESPDVEKALTYFRRAHALGSEAAGLNLGAQLLMGSGPQEEQREGFDILVELSGREGIDDYTLRVAAGYVGYALSVSAAGIEIDHDRGFELLLQGIEADPNNRDFNYVLGRYYESTAGGPIDLQRAAFHFTRAGENGEGRGAWRAGIMNLHGLGIPVDEVEAFRLIQLSADTGYDDGMISLAVMYAVGQGTEIRPELSRIWYEQAASMGNAHALRGLGMMLITGEGGSVDPVRGQALLELAVHGGDEHARYWLEQVTANFDNSRTDVDAAKSNFLNQNGLTLQELYGGERAE